MMKIIYLFSLCLPGIPALAQENHFSLDARGFEAGSNNPDVQLLDVRTSAEYSSGHLKKSLQADWYNQQQFWDRISSMDKSKPVYIYCLTGTRSEAAVKMLKQEGFTHVRDLKGGLIAWKQAGKEVEGARKVKQLTILEYQALVKSTIPVLVDFGAEWCPPCKKMEPVIAQLKNEVEGKFKVVNIDAAVQQGIMKQLKIEALPVFIEYNNGIEVWRKQGMATLNELKEKLL